MYQLTPYLFFAGRCAEALDFYHQCFDGKITNIRLFKDAPQQMDGVVPEWIMHAEFEAPGLKLMLSDGVVAKELHGNNIALSIVVNKLDTQLKLFDRLAQDGRVMLPLADSFMGTRFGKVEDKFGIRWMIHCRLTN
ncbi:TPA: VOC family protein [Vibrio vulnificus]|nr:VOC family protein [Vibrio vulnificus]